MISVEFREPALDAIQAQADYFAAIASEDLSRKWKAAVDRTILSLIRSPEMGSPVFSGHPVLHGLRRLVLHDFPRHLLFYRFQPDTETVVVYSVQHGARDLESVLSIGLP